VIVTKYLDLNERNKWITRNQNNSSCVDCIQYTLIQRILALRRNFQVGKAMTVSDIFEKQSTVYLVLIEARLYQKYAMPDGEIWSIDDTLAHDYVVRI